MNYICSFLLTSQYILDLPCIPYERKCKVCTEFSIEFYANTKNMKNKEMNLLASKVTVFPSVVLNARFY